MTTKKYKAWIYKLLVHINILAIFLCSASSVYAEVIGESNKAIQTVSYEHVLNWSLGLVVVLCLFFACVWFMRKMGGLPTHTRDNMRVIAGLSLGMREKLLLVQMGDKQLVLGVTPGRIDNLLVLEGDDKLFQEDGNSAGEGEFARKLKHFMSDPKK